MVYSSGLKITMKAVGPDHADTAATLRAMANVHDRQGNYDEAMRV